MPSFLFALALMLAVSPAFAEPGVAPSSPGFDPLQTERRFNAWQTERNRARPAVRLPNLKPDETTIDTRLLFTLNQVTVSGAHAIPADKIAATWQPYLGKNVSQADLAAIAGAISDLYRAAGYGLSRAMVPPQDIQGGRVNVAVIEGYIAEVVVTGENVQRFGIASMLEPVRRYNPLPLRKLERQLQLVGDIPGVEVEDTAIEEITPASGRFRLAVEATTRPVSGSLGLDNLGSSSIGPWQSYATGNFNSYVLPGDTLVANLSTIPANPRELAFGRLSYDAPVGADGVKLGATALYSVARPGDARAQDDDKTRTNSIELRGSYTALESRPSSLTLTLAATATNSSDSDNYGPNYIDHVRTVSLAADYRLVDNFGGNNSLSVLWRQGLNVLGASSVDDPLSSGDFAPPSFSVFDAWFTRYQTLSEHWSLKLAAAGQFATAPLLISQQYYVGGASFGRGYGNAVISGDNAIAGTVELRFNQGVNKNYLKAYEFYGFADSGAVWNHGYAMKDGDSLTSVGAGVRLFLENDLKADVGFGVPLTFAGPDNPSRKARLLFSLSSAFRACPERIWMKCS